MQAQKPELPRKVFLFAFYGQNIESLVDYSVISTEVEKFTLMIKASLKNLVHSQAWQHTPIILQLWEYEAAGLQV